MTAWMKHMPLCFAALLFAGASLAREKPSGEWALTIADQVNLRESPFLSARVKIQLALGSWVIVTSDTQNSDDHTWRRVVFSGCTASGNCGNEDAGWVTEKYIALVSSFARITQWKEQSVLFSGPDATNTCYLHADGTFDYRFGAYKDECPPSDFDPKDKSCGGEKGVILRRDRFFLLKFNKELPAWASAPLDRLLIMDEKSNRLCHPPIEAGPNECTVDRLEKNKDK